MGQPNSERTFFEGMYHGSAPFKTQRIYTLKPHSRKHCQAPFAGRCPTHSISRNLWSTDETKALVGGWHGGVQHSRILVTSRIAGDKRPRGGRDLYQGNVSAVPLI